MVVDETLLNVFLNKITPGHKNTVWTSNVSFLFKKSLTMKIKQRKQSSTIFWLFLYESHTSDDFPLSSQNFHYIFILNIKRNVGVGFFFSLLTNRLVYIFKIYCTKGYLLQIRLNQRTSSIKDKRVFFIEVDIVKLLNQMKVWVIILYFSRFSWYISM